MKTDFSTKLDEASQQIRKMIKENSELNARNVKLESELKLSS